MNLRKKKKKYTEAQRHVLNLIIIRLRRMRIWGIKILRCTQTCHCDLPLFSRRHFFFFFFQASRKKTGKKKKKKKKGWDFCHSAFSIEKDPGVGGPSCRVRTATKIMLATQVCSVFAYHLPTTQDDWGIATSNHNWIDLCCHVNFAEPENL
jgi:hypothetical protein